MYAAAPSSRTSLVSSSATPTMVEVLPVPALDTRNALPSPWSTHSMSAACCGLCCSVVMVIFPVSGLQLTSYEYAPLRQRERHVLRLAQQNERQVAAVLESNHQSQSVVRHQCARSLEPLPSAFPSAQALRMR